VTPKALLLVGLGGFFGANLRYVFSLIIPRVTAPAYPQIGTLFVNVVGSLLLAALLEWGGRQTALSQETRLLVATGFFGSFTTFSTFSNEVIALYQTASWQAAFFYLFATNSLCLIAVFIGLWVGNHL